MPEGGQFCIPQNKYRFGAFGPARRDQTSSQHFHLVSQSFSASTQSFSTPEREKKKKSPFLPCCCSNTTQTFYTHRTHNPISSNYCIIPGFKLTLGTLCFSIALLLSLLQHTVTQLLIFLKARITELQVGVPEVWDGVVECESCHGTQSTYHAKCRRECSSGPGRPSIPGKLIVINQVTETEQGLADDYLSPLPLLLPPPLLLFPSSSSSILYCFS